MQRLHWSKMSIFVISVLKLVFSRITTLVFLTHKYKREISCKRIEISYEKSENKIQINIENTLYEILYKLQIYEMFLLDNRVMYSRYLTTSSPFRNFARPCKYGQTGFINMKFHFYFGEYGTNFLR